MRHNVNGSTGWLARRLGRRRALGLAGGAGAAAFLTACGGGEKDSGSRATSKDTEHAAGVISGTAAAGGDQPKPGGAVTYHWPLTPPLDPTINTTYTVQRLAGFTYPRLLKFKTDTDPKTAQNYETMPDLAASQPETLDGGTRYIFKLRPDAKSHNKPPLNGRVYTAEDVKASYERFVGEAKNQNKGAFAQAGVTGVEAPDAQTVVFKLSKPYAPFLSMMANPQYLWIMPKETGTTFDPDRDMVGAGPFMLDSNQPDVAIKLKKHPEYFLKGQPYLDGVTLAIVQEAAQQLAQFQAEKLDMATLSHEQIPDARRSVPKATVVKFPSATMPFLFTQLRNNGPFKDERLRQALSLSVDRDALLKLTWDGEGWWQNMVPTHMGKWWTDPKDPANRPSTRWFGTGDRKKDLAEATALLKAAGYDETKKLPVKVYYTPNGYTDRYTQWAEATAAMLKDTNVFQPQLVSADYRGEWIVSGGVLFGRIPDDGVAFALQSGFPDAHDYLFNPLHSKSTRNHSGVNDPEIDALFDKEVAALDDGERVKLIRSITARMNDKAYYAPLMIGPDYWVLQPWVKNFTLGLTYGWGVEIFANTSVSR